MLGELMGKLNLKSFVAMAIILLFSSCLKKEEIIGTYSHQTNIIKPGDIIVSNGNSDSLILLDATGEYKKTLYDVDNISETISGIAYKPDTKEIIFTVTGAALRVGAVSIVDGSYRNFIINVSLTTPLRGVAVMTDGNVLVTHAGIIQKFSTYGTRITAGAWPKTLMGTPQQISALPNGGFLNCSDATDLVRTYDSAGVQTGTSVASGIATTTDVFACMRLSDGRIANAWNGTTDTISLWNSDFTGRVNIYADTSVLGNPRGIAQRSNGNLLISDATNNYLVEIDIDGNLIDKLGGSILNGPTSVFVMPNY